MASLRIEAARPADWERVRAVRLRALADSPEAFGTLLVEDEARRVREWRGRLQCMAARTFLALLGDDPVGIATGSPWDEGDVGGAGLYGMWVAPEARGQVVGDALVEAVVAWARAAGHSEIRLSVGDDNAPAIALYARHGFEPTGQTSTLPAPRAHVTEHERMHTL